MSMEQKMQEVIEASIGNKLLDEIKQEIDVCIDLCSRFMPVNISVDNPKELAMYELFQRLKGINKYL